MDKKICKFFLNNNCKIGQNCKFSHDIEKKIYKKDKIQSNKYNFKVHLFNKAIFDLNLKRTNQNIPIFEVSFVEIIDNSLLIFFKNKNFAWMFDYKNNQFDEEQLIFNKKIKNEIYFIFKGKFGTMGNTLGLAFNYFNEFKMERKSCICFKNIENLEKDENDIILNISQEDSINYFYHNENILAVSLKNNNPNNENKIFKLKLYFLNHKDLFEKDDYQNILDKDCKLFEFKNQIEVIYNFKNLFLN